MSDSPVSFPCRVALMSLTGMGNFVLDELLNSGLVEDILVFTRKEPNVFPYFHCEQLDELCKRKSISCHYLNPNEREGFYLLREFSPDLLLCATYHHILSARLINETAKLCLNIHPSLLPSYRGPTPTQWCIYHRNKKSGVSIHRLSKAVDGGELFMQQEIEIGDDWTDGELRKSLYSLAGRLLRGWLSSCSVEEKPRTKKNSYASSYFPKFLSPEGAQIRKREEEDRESLERALAVHPEMRNHE